MSYQAENPCKWCKAIFFVDRICKIKKQKLCSSSCRTSYNNTNRVWTEESKQKVGSKNKGKLAGANNPNYSGGGKIFNCVYCSNEFEVATGQLTGKKYIGKYCSLKCYQGYRASFKISDDQLKVHKRFRNGLCELVRRNNPLTKSTMLNHVDYTVPELRTHLENLFEPGMNWENYGEWHIDHKRPASYYNFSTMDDKEFKECWALSNLQPLWAYDNLSKGGKNTKLNQEKYG